MIDITDTRNCAGCEACVNRCPKHCISMKADVEGFLYPVVDKTTCIDCGLCEIVCPITNLAESSKPLQVLATINTDNSIRKESSSGGVFTPLAEKIINEKGVVFGVRFDENWQVVFDYTETLEGLTAYRGSKYVQATINNAYQKCEQFLKEGRWVLFTGTPCQVSALKLYLKKEYSNLITADFACHGAPSREVWSRYLEEEIENHKTAQRVVVGKSTVSSSLNLMSLIEDIKFREKSDGWKKFRFVLKFDEPSGDVEKSSVLSSIHYLNPYYQAFNTGVLLRPSCYVCKIKNACRSHADITMADFWGISEVDSTFDDDKGTSLILLNTEKGVSFFNNITLRQRSFSYDIALKYNEGLREGSYYHPRRDFFFSNFPNTKSVIALLKESQIPTLSMQISRYKNAIVRRIKKLL